jgi:hypothetical protein
MYYTLTLIGDRCDGVRECAAAPAIVSRIARARRMFHITRTHQIRDVITRDPPHTTPTRHSGTKETRGADRKSI